MPAWAPGTRRKAGSPDSFDLTPALWGTFVSPVVYSWLSPLFAQMVTITISTDTLCASPPPDPETWTMDDLIGSVNPDTAAAEFAKLTRAALAGSWPAYCEFTPADPVGVDAIYPQLLGFDLNDWLIQPSGSGFVQYALHHPEADFWVVTAKMDLPSSDGSLPQLFALREDDTLGPNVGIFDNTGTLHVAVLVPNLAPRTDATMGGPNTFLPYQFWRVYWPVDATGRQIISISAWTLHGTPRPPMPLPWPLAPADPTAPLPYQFSDVCAAALCDMAAWLPNLQEHVVQTALDAATALTDLTAVKTELDLILADVTAAPPAGTVEYAGPSGLSGSNTVYPPLGSIAALVTMAPPAATSESGSPGMEAYWETGYVMVGRGGFWHASERLKHAAQWVILPSGTEYLGLDLAAGVTASVSWLVPAPPVVGP